MRRPRTSSAQPTVRTIGRGSVRSVSDRVAIAVVLLCLLAIAAALTWLVVPDSGAQCRWAVTRGQNYSGYEMHPCDWNPLSH